MSIDVQTRERGDILLVAPSELQDYLAEAESAAFEQHRKSIQTILSLSGVRFYDDERSNLVELSQKPLDDPIVLLGEKAVKSVMLSHTFYDDTLPEDGFMRNNWKVKTHGDSVRGTKMRFFVAKSEIGDLQVADDVTARIVERRTFAGISTDSQAMAREIDIKHVLGTDTRHKLDPRDVIVAPTSVSFYARKLD